MSKREEFKRKLDRLKLIQLSRNKNGQIIFISLFTSILALFVIIVSIIEIEENSKDRNYQKLVLTLYEDVQYYKDKTKLDWLLVEKTIAKGVRLTISSTILKEHQLFTSGRAKINPYFVPYLKKVIGLIYLLELDRYPQKQAKLVSKITHYDERLLMTIRVEGHTDSKKMLSAGLYKSNIELSSFRAYSLMDLIKLYTKLPDEHFSIAGYGSFKPISTDATEAINRRVEIYIYPQVLPKKREGLL
jgi:chemotaxis protein MotB